MSGKIIKVIACIAVLAAVALGGYYIGKNTSQSIETAIPKEQIDASAAPDNSELPRDPAGGLDSGEAVTYVTKSDISATSTGSWTEVTSYTGDMTNDGGADIIRVYTSAASENGQIKWDITQNWIVELETSSGEYYTFLNQSITNGSVYISVTENQTHAKQLSIVTTGMGMTVKQYIFSSSGFAENIVTEAVGGNMVFSSIPSYN